jgi:histidine triad (HIT) family protein
MSEKTIFEKIVDKEIPTEVIYEDDFVMAFNDIEPQAPHHVLIIPKKNIPTINDLQEADEALIGKLFIAASKIAKEKGFADDGYRCVMNCNKHGQQTVFHLHLHLLGGKQLSWPPGC